MSSLIRVVYTPEGGSKRSWEIDLNNPAWDITFNTEKITGWPWAEFSAKISAYSVIALRALVWTLRKRDEPKLPLESVQITFDEVAIEDPDDDGSDDADDGEPDEVDGDPKA